MLPVILSLKFRKAEKAEYFHQKYLHTKVNGSIITGSGPNYARQLMLCGIVGELHRERAYKLDDITEADIKIRKLQPHPKDKQIYIAKEESMSVDQFFDQERWGTSIISNSFVYTSEAKKEKPVGKKAQEEKPISKKTLELVDGLVEERATSGAASSSSSSVKSKEGGVKKTKSRTESEEFSKSIAEEFNIYSEEDLYEW